MTIFVFEFQNKATASVSGYMATRLTTSRGIVEDPWDDNLRDNSSSFS